ncbi:MAG: cupin domain-containing protein [Acidobacteriaceae bacterium]|nr:cupin domain-containing protein [Acidobacteriaceae bacterium]
MHRSVVQLAVALAWPAMVAATDPAASIRIIHLADATPFHMGKVTSVRIISPGTGAKQLTLNYSTSQPGDEFSQHTHDGSADTILVLQGAADLRQGPNRTPMKAGTSAWVPGHQIHGTITTAKDTIMISTQVPPDLVLYSGARDSSKPGAAPVQGQITPGAVKYISFADRNGAFVDPGMGALHEAVSRRVLTKGQSIESKGSGSDGEQLFFVWKGAVRVASGAEKYTMGEKDTAFCRGEGTVKVTGDSADPAIVFQVQAPIHSSK